MGKAGMILSSIAQGANGLGEASDIMNGKKANINPNLQGPPSPRGAMQGMPDDQSIASLGLSPSTLSLGQQGARPPMSGGLSDFGYNRRKQIGGA